MIDKNKIKKELEKERDMLVNQLGDMGKLNPETNEWEAVPDERGYVEVDQNDMADRFEDFEERSSMLKVLQTRLKNILSAIKGLAKGSFGKCEVCKKSIESDRLKVNPAAKTCKAHMEK